jgi:hypothetical protein
VVIAIAESTGTGTFTNGSVTPDSDGVASFSTLTYDTGQTIKIKGTLAGFTTPEPNKTVVVGDNYTITYTVKDSLTASNLSDVTLTVYSGNNIVYGPTLKPGGIFSDITLPYSADGYTFQFEKNLYVTDAQTKTPSSGEDLANGTYDNAITWNEYLMSVTEATADYQVKSSFVYNEPAYDGTTLKSGTDQLSIRLWLERRGILITDTSANILGTANVVITTDESTGATTTVSLGSDTDGLFWTTISTITTDAVGLTLTSGRTYYARCNIPWGGTSGTQRTYTSGTTFTITVSEKINELKVLANTIKDTTDLIHSATTSIAGQTSKIPGIETAVETTIPGQVSTIKTETAKILTATGESSLPTKIETERARVVTELETAIEPDVTSGILNRESAVKQGDTVTIRYRGPASGLSDTTKITVYDPNNVKRVDAQKMTEIGTTGVYEYDLKFDSSWGKGDYTILTSESTKGTLDALIMTALGTDMEDIAGQVSAVLGTTAGLTGLDSTITTLDSQLSTISTAIASLVQPGGTVSEGIEKTVETTLEPIVAALKKVAGEMKSLGGTEGYNLDDLYQVSGAHTKDIKSLSNKTLELKKLLEVIRAIMEKKLQEPVITTWYESGSVILRVLIVNPSKTLSRSVPFKYYFPKEVKREHIIDKGDLELGYDPQQSLYYVYQDMELKPGESRRLSVEIEDIWIIDKKEIDSSSDQAKKFLLSLKDTPYYDRGEFLVSKIEKQLQAILDSQNLTASVNPEEHISVYRENLKSLDLVKQDLLEMERLSNRVTHVSATVTWRVIIMIVVFIGILSLVFFFIWQRKLGEVSPGLEEPTKKEEPHKIVEAESRGAKEEKKVDIDDIKKRMQE